MIWIKKLNPRYIINGANKNYFLAGSSGLIAALAYSFSSLGFLVFFAFVPLFWVLSSVSKIQVSNFKLFLLGFLTGSIYFLFSLRWFLNLYPLDGLGIENKFISLVIALFIWLALASVMAGFWGLFSLGIVRPKFRRFSIFAIPALFVVLEYLRAYVIAVIGYSSSNLFGAHWTLGNMAYSLSANHLALWLASYVGIYGLTFIIILINWLVFGWLRSKNFLWVGLLSIVLIGTSVLGKNWTNVNNLNQKVLNFAVIQTKQQHKLTTGGMENLTAFKTELELLEKTTRDHPEVHLIIFPEGTDFFKNLSLFLRPAQIKTYFYHLSQQSLLIVDNSRVSAENGGYYSRVLLLNTQQDGLDYYDKKLLTPLGEYLPSWLRPLLSLVAPKTKQTFDSLGSFVSGQNQQPTNFNDWRFGVAACSDLLSPSLIRQQTRGNDLLIGLASTSLFHGSPTLTRQNLAINRFRAAENGLPIVLAANFGRSYALDWQGNISQIAPNDTEQIFTGQIIPGQHKTWYNKLGDWPIVLASLLIVLVSSFQFLVSRQRLSTRD